MKTKLTFRLPLLDSNAKPAEAEPNDPEAGGLTIVVPDREVQEWIQEHYHSRIIEIARKYDICEINYLPEDGES